MKYFIDTNLIIDLIEKKAKDNCKDKIIELKNKLKDSDNEFFINRLVIVETLRNTSLKKTKIYQKLKDTLEAFTQIDITPEIYEQAIDLSRLCRSKGVVLKGSCEAIDFIHFITAKFYDLELLSCDKDFAKIDEVYQK